MAISQTFYDLDREMRMKYGEEWHKIVDDDHPLLVAMRNVIFNGNDPTKKAGGNSKLIEAFEDVKHIGTYSSLKECASVLGLHRDVISRQLRGVTNLVAGKYTFEYAVKE